MSARLGQGTFGDINRMVFDRIFPKRQRTSPAMSRQERAEMIVRRQLLEMCLARFQWTGLPDGMSSDHIENMLTQFGQVIVGLDPRNGGPVALQATPMGSPNYQNEYAVFKGVGSRYTAQLFQTVRSLKRGEPTEEFPTGAPVWTDANGVVIWNNATRTGDLEVIQFYAERLAELDTTIDINSMNARRNKVVFSNSDTDLANANILNELAEGQPVLKLRNPEMLANITTLDLSVHPDSIDRLHIFRGRMFNECMTLLGIDNTNQDKKERLVTDELGGNDDQIARVRSSNLNQRRRAARQITKLLNDAGIKTVVGVDYYVEDDPANDPHEERVSTNGDVHTDAQ